MGNIRESGQKIRRPAEGMAERREAFKLLLLYKSESGENKTEPKAKTRWIAKKSQNPKKTTENLHLW